MSFSNIFSKKPMKTACVHIILRKNQCFLYFIHKMPISQFSKPWSLWWMVLIWYQWKEDIHSYTMVVNLGLYNLPYWLSWGLQQPRFGKYVREKCSGELGLSTVLQHIWLGNFSQIIHDHDPRLISCTGLYVEPKISKNFVKRVKWWRKQISAWVYRFAWTDLIIR